jgi:hypothetical protein
VDLPHIDRQHVDLHGDGSLELRRRR